MKTYSRRELYALGETLGESVTTRKVGGGLILGGGGSGGGSAAPTQTTSTSYQTNIPEYAKPYVETMLGATQQQLFQGNPTGDGGFNITGFQPYKAYGGTYDAQGNQTSYDPTKSVAGFSPMQQQAQQGTANLQTPGQYNTAMDVTGMGIMNAARMGAQANPQDFQQQVGGYMNPYMQQVLQPQMDELRRQYGISGTQQAGQATQAGAFGGSRDAIMAAENQRNLGMAQNQAIGQAYGNAFNQAQNQYNQSGGFQLQANQAAMQNASQLAGLGQQQLTAQQGILGLQNQMGAQQQAYNQQVINQAMQDYANAQQYPLMQLGTMSNMLRGLPMQATTTNQYVAAPNPITQGIGAAGAAASLYNATKAEGGVIKSMASGGIANYDVGGEVYSDLERMDPKELQQIAQHSDSPSMQKMARAILARSGPVQAASGGIMHFQAGSKVYDPEAFSNDIPELQPGTRYADAINKYKAESQGADQNISTNVPPTSFRAPADRGLPGRNIDTPAALNNQISGMQTGTPYADAMNKIKAESEARANAPMSGQGKALTFLSAPLAAAADVVASPVNALRNIVRNPLDRSERPSMTPFSDMRTSALAQDTGAEGINQIREAENKQKEGKLGIEDEINRRMRALEKEAKQELTPAGKDMFRKKELQNIIKERSLVREKESEAGKAAVAQLVSNPTGATPTTTTSPGGINGATGTKPAYTQPGILGAATAGTLPNAAPRVTPDVLESPELTALKKQLTTDRDKQLTESNKSQDEILKEIRDREGPNVGLQNYRAEEMARKANLGDEARRQKDMRLAEFFSKWGTTPGATLVAGMTALKSSIPDMINDRKEARKLEKESDKVIFDLEQADRLEKRGQDDKAYARKTDAAKRAEEINKLLAQIEERQLAAKVQHEGNKMHLQGQMASVAAHERANTIAEQRGVEDKKFNTLTAAENALRSLEASQTAERDKAGGQYQRASTLATLDPSKQDAETAKRINEAKKYIKEKDAQHAADLKRIQSQVEVLRSRVIPKTEATADNNDPLKVR